MAHSNSSLNCFANCMKKYELTYIDKITPPVPPSPHLTFGSMAHEVLCNAGKLRDDANDHLVEQGEYYNVIPSEVIGGDLKDYFKINNWRQYFVPVIKQTAKYENDIIKELTANGESVQIEREIKLQLTPDELADLGYYNVKQPLVGIIDLLIYTPTRAVILDYKFSSTRKTQDDFDHNSQLPLYALFVNKLYDIPLHNIQIGYIDIPKQMFGAPLVLSNGTLSRAKSQNVSQEMYKACVTEIHGDDPYYNCDEGGYYHDIYCELANNKAAYLSLQYLDIDIFANVTEDLTNCANMIDKMQEEKMPFLRKYDSYSCKSCEFVTICKPWLGVNNE